MTKEIYHEGWLIKSPPTKRIWRARWRRRWFTLKQGEIPEQFCLEYYTDRNCRKLKGVIDLDQCEQVDSGLRLEHRKQKFQHMFDVKTPRRTYYLAAESEKEMNDWVSCICQVCNLQDLSKQQDNNDNRQYYNVGADAIVNQPLPVASSSNSVTRDSSTLWDRKKMRGSVSTARSMEPMSENNNSVYQNCDAPLRNLAYSNRETMICDGPLGKQPTAKKQPHSKEPKEVYYNFHIIACEANRMQTFERSHSLRTTSTCELLNGDSSGTGLPPPSHGRTQSLIERKTASLARKIPENLKLNDSSMNDSEPSPALSTSSGPYIAISECISGNPLIDRENPMTPLNSLDPKFYDTPRSHINNIGLNLTNEQPYSPKRNNGPSGATLQAQLNASRSGRSSPTDSESVFTDDEEWQLSSTEAVGDRKLRPSESSVENDSIVFTYAQRFSKPPDEESASNNRVHTRRAKHVAGLLLEEVNQEEQNKEANSSDTENASPAITFGPKDVSSCVEESYDIPRSHQMPYYNLNSSNEMSELSPTLTEQEAKTSTPKSDSNNSLSASNQQLAASTLQRHRPHFYTNAAPTKIEGNVFRYDFDEQPNAPVVDRKLKPKVVSDDRKSKVSVTPTMATGAASTSQTSPSYVPVRLGDLRPPCIDRKLKPTTPIKLETNSLLRRGGASNLSFSASSTDSEFQPDHSLEQFSKTLPRNYNNSSSSSKNNHASLTPFTLPSTTAARQIGKLEYFDLDHSNPPPICKNSLTSASTSNLSAQQTGFNNQGIPSFSLPGRGTSSSSIAPAFNKSTNDASGSVATGIMYKSVDFVKTEAFMRTRQDAELNRAQNRLN